MRLPTTRSLVTLPLTALAAGCLAESAPKWPASAQPSAQAPSVNPVTDDTYVYFRSNATGWSAVANSATKEIADGVLRKRFTIAEPWMASGSLQVVFTLTDQQNGVSGRMTAVSPRVCVKQPC